MLFIVAIIHVSLIPDKNTPQMSNSGTTHVPYCPPTHTGLSTAEELKKYMELRDMGAITEEEFQAKKDQLLKK